MPYQKGQSGNPKGRPPSDTSFATILRQYSASDKRQLCKVAYRFALQGDVRWADWITRNSGNLFKDDLALPEGSTIREILIRETRLASPDMGENVGNTGLTQPALPAPDASDTIESTATLTSDTPE